jgi:SAM-dependent methyltransferase
MKLLNVSKLRKSGFLQKELSRLGNEYGLDLESCAALRTRDEIDRATVITQRLGLLSHHDRQKNWDCLKSLHYVFDYSNPEDPILDVGASARSVILEWLEHVGYKNLYACDVRPTNGHRNTIIKFGVQDLTKTNYPSEMFQIITSISVIEHGVDSDAYFREMHRLLRPGGLLLTSTDYWSEPVDCKGIYPYGNEMGEMKVFTPEEIRNLCFAASKLGFTLCKPLELTTQEKAVRWERTDREYTFVFFALRKNF